MFNKLGNEIYEELKKVSSTQFKRNINTTKMCFAIELVLFIPLTIYCFSLKNLWWLAIIPLGIIGLMYLIHRNIMKWLLKQYQEALLRENAQKKNEIKEEEEKQNDEDQ